jgi:NAD(P)-dependent dehydrogenase (short-subunit alcohol dehydrogenase family)
MKLNLSGKTVLITGGSKGIGRACAEVFAEEGCRLHLAARGEEALIQAKAEIESKHSVEVSIHPVDLSQGDKTRELAESCGDIDILVNNAGAIPNGDLWQIEEPRWREAWDLKLFGYINLCRAVYDQMRSRNQGVIVNVIGAGGEKPTFNYIAGGTANAGLMAFTRALGARSLREGIRVVAVNPGLIKTERLEDLLRSTAEKRLGDAGKWKELLPQKPPPGEPVNIAHTVVFLASDCAAYITGTVVTADGGSSAQ